MTKTNGTREIDLNKEECSNCLYYHNNFSWYNGQVDKGKVVNIIIPKVDSLFDRVIGYEIKNCQVCNGTGYISVCCDNKLELE